MIVCLCEGINDRTIRAAIDEGACNVRAVGERCRAGTSCGLCRCDIKALLRRRDQPEGVPEAAVAK